MEFFGAIAVAIGALLMALGGLYLLAEYRFGGAVFYWSLMWGLMIAGIGLALMGTQRRWLAIAGVLACVVSAALTVYWHQLAILDASWLWLIGIGCSTGILYGAVAFARRTSVLRRARRHEE
jgi:hypothetical protein